METEFDFWLDVLGNSVRSKKWNTLLQSFQKPRVDRVGAGYDLYFFDDVGVYVSTTDHIIEDVALYGKEAQRYFDEYRPYTNTLPLGVEFGRSLSSIKAELGVPLLIENIARPDLNKQSALTGHSKLSSTSTIARAFYKFRDYCVVLYFDDTSESKLFLVELKIYRIAQETFGLPA
jgi:hypothetical protein